MKRYLFFPALLLFTVIIYSSWTDVGAQNLDEPTITTQIRYGTGAEVTIAYDSKFWTGSRENPSPQSISNNYHDEMAMLQNNVQLQIGPTLLDPAIYVFGFVPVAEDTWEVVIKSEAGEVVSRLPIVMRVEPNIVDYLSIILRPGRTDQDFIMTMLFGTRSTSLRWTITGVPVQNAPGTEPQLPIQPEASVPEMQTGIIPDLGPSPAPAGGIINGMTQGNAVGAAPQAAGSTINELTRTAPPLKKRAGSGSFRRLMEIYEKEQN